MVVTLLVPRVACSRGPETEDSALPAEGGEMNQDTLSPSQSPSHP